MVIKQLRNPLFFKTKILFKVIFVVQFFWVSFLYSHLNYFSTKKERNYFFNLGYGIDFNNSLNHVVTSGVHLPWFPSLSTVSSEIQYTFFYHPLFNYHNFLTYHQFTILGFRYYTQYDFDFVPQFNQITNHRLKNGVNFLFNFFLISMELNLLWTSQIWITSRYTFSLFFFQENQIGLRISQKNNLINLIPYVVFNLNNFFFKFEFDIFSQRLKIIVNYVHSFFRIKSQFQNRALSSNQWFNQIYLFDNQSISLVPF